jgi:hypothetical protein
MQFAQTIVITFNMDRTIDTLCPTAAELAPLAYLEGTVVVKVLRVPGQVPLDVAQHIVRAWLEARGPHAVTILEAQPATADYPAIVGAEEIEALDGVASTYPDVVGIADAVMYPCVNGARESVGWCLACTGCQTVGAEICDYFYPNHRTAEFPNSLLPKVKRC